MAWNETGDNTTTGYVDAGGFKIDGNSIINAITPDYAHYVGDTGEPQWLATSDPYAVGNVSFTKNQYGTVTVNFASLFASGEVVEIFCLPDGWRPPWDIYRTLYDGDDNPYRICIGDDGLVENYEVIPSGGCILRGDFSFNTVESTTVGIVGLIGDAGPQGATGPQGPQGPQGIRGNDGIGAAYAAGTTYAKHAICVVDNVLYTSLVDNNIGNYPPTSAEWEVVILSFGSIRTLESQDIRVRE